MNSNKMYIRPFHYFENDLSFKKFIDKFCVVPRKYPIRNKSEDQMDYFCEKAYFYRQYRSVFDNMTYKTMFEVNAKKKYSFYFSIFEIQY